MGINKKGYYTKRDGGIVNIIKDYTNKQGYSTGRLTLNFPQDFIGKRIIIKIETLE